MLSRDFLPSSVVIAVYLLLTTTSSPSLCERANGDREKTKQEGDQRHKRAGGSVSGLLFGAIGGMIGMTDEAIKDHPPPLPPPSDGGCLWFGTAPLCNSPCPAEYDFIRAHNGRCSDDWFAGFCTPDPSFGKPCIVGSKRFCCRSDPNDCSWSGRWMGANNMYNMYCKYDDTEGRCGSLDCSVNHYDFKSQNSAIIGGPKCDQLEMWGLTGKATCGLIAWRNGSNETVNCWYKTSSPS